MVSDEKKLKMKISITKKYRMKMGLCQLCGSAEISDHDHICIENYIHADMKNYTKSDIIRMLSKEIVKEEKKIENSEIIIKEQKPVIIEKKYVSYFDYICVENFHNNLSFDVIYEISNKYKNLSIYLLCINSFKNSNIPVLIKTKKASNVIVKYIDEISDDECDSLVFSSYKIYTSISDIVEKCKKLKKPYVQFPNDIEITSELLRQRYIKI